MKPRVYLYIILILIDFIGFSYSGPHEFCLDQFDHGDCGKPPTYVFHYYKPGSRCEVVKWRGCPTRNRFTDEYLCFHYCIGSLFGRDDESKEDGYNRIANLIDSVTEDEWVNELTDLKIEDMQALDTILDEVIEERNHTLEKLVLKKTTVAPVESATEAPTEEETKAPEPTPEPATDSPTSEDDAVNTDDEGGGGGIGSVEEVLVP